MPVAGRHVGRPAVLLVAALGAAMILGGCSGASDRSPAASVRGGGSTATPADPSGRPAPSSSGPATPPAPASTSGSSLVDHGLLDILPESVGGSPIEAVPDVENELAANDLVRLLASGLAVGRVSSADGKLAVITIVRLSALARGDAAFASYRETYDQSACESVGGLGTSSVTTVAGHPVDRTECLGGATILHLRVRDDSVIISILSLPTADLAEEIIENLRS